MSANTPKPKPLHIAFVSNFLTHHQTPMSDYLVAQKDVTYHFIALEPMLAERKALGWDEEITQPYLVQYEEGGVVNDAATKIIAECDILMVGRAPFELFAKRIEAGKPTIYYTDHLLKNVKAHFELRRTGRLTNEYLRPGMLPNTYLLAASGFVAAEMNERGAFIDRSFKWGYFPETHHRPPLDELIAGKPTGAASSRSDTDGPLEIAWVARTLDWKHPEMAIFMARRLRDKGYRFKLRMLGTGPEDERIERMIVRYGLDTCVDFVGAVHASDVKDYLNAANILIFTSDLNEGWGAVVNEAMNAACTVVASNKAGAVPYLIEDDVNGLVFRSGSVDGLTTHVMRALDDAALRERLGRAAYATIVDEWNPEVAAARLLALCRAIAAGTDPAGATGQTATDPADRTATDLPYYASGPVSPA
ncbi:MAG: glycosyltransferase [Coriobacteriia bacterium]|nr:glycosyltransferase [Coriobacteriia bacterium]